MRQIVGYGSWFYEFLEASLKNVACWLSVTMLPTCGIHRLLIRAAICLVCCPFMHSACTPGVASWRLYINTLYKLHVRGSYLLKGCSTNACAVQVDAATGSDLLKSLSKEVAAILNKPESVRIRVT